jgi:PAS domain S-box-containing protein
VSVYLTDQSAPVLLLLAVIVLAVLQLLWNRMLRNRVEASTAELRAANQTLSAQATRLSDLYNNVPCGYHSLDAGGVITEINDTELRWLGSTREAVEGRREFVTFLASHSADKFRAMFERLKAGGDAQGEERIFELAEQGGLCRIVSITSTVVTGVGGVFAGMRSTVYDITRQERAAQALRATLDNTPSVAVQWFNQAGRVCYWNKASTEVFGWSEAEAMGRTLDEIGLYTPGQTRGFVDALQEISRTGRGFEPAESSFTRKDGSEGVLLSTLFPIPAPDGTTYFVCMDIDVTERQRSEERLRATLENTPGVAIQWFDREARVLYWNPASEMLYGLSTDEAMGKRMDELLYDPEQYGDFVRFLREVERGQDASGIAEATVKGRHGVMVTVMRRACMVPGIGAEPIFACMEVDITDGRALEREHEQLNVILSRVTEAVPVCLSYLDAEGRYVWTNARNATRLGIEPDRMIGRTVREVNVALREGWQSPAVEAALDGKPQHDETAWQHANGEMHAYERFLVPDLDAQGVLRGCTSVWLDVTSRKEAENRIHRLNRVYAVLSNINAALVRTKNLRDLADEACRIAVEYGGFGVAWIGLLDPATGRINSLSWAGEDAQVFAAMEDTTPAPIGERAGLLTQCIREKRPVVNNDISAQTLPDGSRRMITD